MPIASGALRDRQRRAFKRPMVSCSVADAAGPRRAAAWYRVSAAPDRQSPRRGRHHEDLMVAGQRSAADDSACSLSNRRLAKVRRPAGSRVMRRRQSSPAWSCKKPKPLVRRMRSVPASQATVRSVRTVRILPYGKAAQRDDRRPASVPPSRHSCARCLTGKSFVSQPQRWKHYFVRA